MTELNLENPVEIQRNQSQISQNSLINPLIERNYDQKKLDYDYQFYRTWYLWSVGIMYASIPVGIVILFGLLVFYHLESKRFY